MLPNVREILEALRARSDVRSYLLTGNTRGGARAKLTHYDLFTYFPGRRVRRGRGRSRDHRRARARAGAAGGPGRRRGDLRHRRHAARHRVRRTPSARARSRWRPAAIRVEELRVASSVAGVRTSCRRPTNSCELIDGRRAAADVAADGRAPRMKHGIRQFPRALAGDAAGAALVSRARDAYPDWRARSSQPIASSGQSARAAAQGGPRVLMATVDRLVRARGHARERAGGGADVPRRRGARAAVRRRDDAPAPNARRRCIRIFAASSSTVRRATSAATAAGRPSASIAQLGITVHRIRRLADAGRIAPRRSASRPTLPRRLQIEAFTLDGLAIGEHAHAGALRFFATGVARR